MATDSVGGSIILYIKLTYKKQSWREMLLWAPPALLPKPLAAVRGLEAGGGDVVLLVAHQDGVGAVVASAADPDVFGGPQFLGQVLWQLPICSSVVPGSSLGRYVFGSEISYNKAPPRLPGLGC
jgi:hypothetical protein